MRPFSSRAKSVLHELDPCIIAHAVCTKFDLFPSRGTYFFLGHERQLSAQPPSSFCMLRRKLTPLRIAALLL